MLAKKTEDMYFKNKIYILSILLFANLHLLAQDVESAYNNGIKQQNQYTQQEIEPATFNKQEWNKLKDELKIGKHQQKKEEETKKQFNKKLPKNYKLPHGLIIIAKWSMFGILLAILLFLVMRVLGINPFNKKTDKNKINISLEELEENLDTASIDPHLYEAIKNKNYKLAIRLYYLKIIQKLALKEKIIWKKYKTNKHYLNELKNKEDYTIMKQLTLTYEICWFGENDVTEDEYNFLNKDFVNFLQNIK